MAVGRLQFLLHFWAEGFSSSLLLSQDILLCGPLLRAAQSVAVSKWKNKSVARHELNSGMTFHHFCCILFVRSKSQSLAHIYRALIPGSWVRGSHLKTAHLAGICIFCPWLDNVSIWIIFLFYHHLTTSLFFLWR